MAISFEECRVILDEFKRLYPKVLMRRNEIHGMQVAYPNDSAVVVILVSDVSTANSIRAELRLPTTVSYKFRGHDGNASVEVRVAPRARAQAGVPCRPGDVASGDPNAYYGTLGWNLYLNNVMVGLSNWHVLCCNGNDTPLGSNITINGNVEATLYLFQKVNYSGNSWDYALAQYIRPADAAGEMRICDDNQMLPYPGDLSPKGSVMIGDNAQYYKVGARLPTCRTGTLVAVGDRSITYDDGTIRGFDSQLIFSKMTDPGDSGAVIVRQSDTSVTGLNFAGNDTETIANPLYLLDWTRTGSIRFDGGTEVPMFISGTAPTIKALPGRTGTNESLFTMDSPPPSLSSTGLFFLGAATRMNQGGAFSYTDGTSPPPPPWPNGRLQVVVASSTIVESGLGRPTISRETVLYFG